MICLENKLVHYQVAYMKKSSHDRDNRKDLGCWENSCYGQRLPVLRQEVLHTPRPTRTVCHPSHHSRRWDGYLSTLRLAFQGVFHKQVGLSQRWTMSGRHTHHGNKNYRLYLIDRWKAKIHHKKPSQIIWLSERMYMQANHFCIEKIVNAQKYMSPAPCSNMRGVWLMETPNNSALSWAAFAKRKHASIGSKSRHVWD